MILDNLTHMHMFHCGLSNHNKVWGYFLHGVNIWAFWGGVGKAWSFKYHGANSLWVGTTISDLRDQKILKGYSATSEAQMDEWDPEWRARFCERFTYFLLQQPVI